MDHVEQISVFLENKAGRLAEVTRILAEARINIRALSLADTSDFGILRLIVNDNAKAKRELKAHGFTVGKTDVVAVEVSDQPGGLHHILRILPRQRKRRVHVRLRSQSGNAVIIFRIDNLEEALRFLKKTASGDRRAKSSTRCRW